MEVESENVVELLYKKCECTFLGRLFLFKEKVKCVVIFRLIASCSSSFSAVKTLAPFYYIVLIINNNTGKTEIAAVIYRHCCDESSPIN